MNTLSITVVLGLFGGASLASAHGGGLDAQGGHRDTKANNYHFHQGPLDGNTYASKEAATRALEAYESGEEVTDGGTEPVDPLILPPFDLAPYRPSAGPDNQIVIHQAYAPPIQRTP
mgnify:FL=1